MKVWVVLLILLGAGFASVAKPAKRRVAAVSPVTRKLWLVKSACQKHLKTRPVCGCVTKNISNNIERGQFGQAQLDDVVLVMKNLYVMGDIFEPRLESMADYLVGLEFHCQKNPKYSVN